MEGKEEKNKIAFNIDSIELISRNIGKAPIKKFGKADFLYDVGLEIKIDGKEKKSTHTINISIRDNNEELGNISVACTYVIYNFEIFIVKEKGKTLLADNVIDLLNTISIGTTRGVAFSEFRGSFLEDAILPILDLKGFQQ